MDSANRLDVSQMVSAGRPRRKFSLGLPVSLALGALFLSALAAAWLSRQPANESPGLSASETTVVESTPESLEDPPPPATLPTADQADVVVLQLPLFDAYTGTGLTGSTELYLDMASGTVCNVFQLGDLPANNYFAYIHEATFPQEGPVIIDLGEIVEQQPQCAQSDVSDLSRLLGSSGSFYVATHSSKRDISLRGQLNKAVIVTDNRSAESLALSQGNEPTTTAGGLFGSDDGGAFLVADANQLTFEGRVKDEETANQLRSVFGPLSSSGIEIVDNLSIDASAPQPSGRVILADALLFASGDDQISGDPAVLATVAQLMDLNPTWEMTVTGHTDNVGEWLYNIELSLRRANDFRDRLAELGVDPNRIRVQGAGPESPLEDNATPEGREKNRRIEIRLRS